MAMFSRIVSWAAQRGPSATRWVKNNSSRVWQWINDGMSFSWIVNQIDAQRDA